MSVTTRRRFLQAASSVAAVLPLAAPRFQRGSSRRIVAFAGTYSSPGGALQGRGEGIHVLEMDPASGALTQRDVVRTTENPTWLAFNRPRSHLYTANEVSAAGTGAGTVSAYSVDRGTGRPTLLNSVRSEGAGPAHVSVHPTGKHALVANYGGGTVAVLPIQPDGRLGAASDVERHQGTPGSARPSSAPP